MRTGQRVLVCFMIAGSACDPGSVRETSLSMLFKRAWRERTVLSVDDHAETVRVLDYHLEPVDVPAEWCRDVPEFPLEAFGSDIAIGERTL